MVRFLDATPQAGVVGARLVHGDGSFQHSAFAFPGLLQILFDLFPLHPRLLESRLNGRYPRHLYQAGRPFAVDHPLGAALMIRAQTLAQVGGFDERFFMYCEEVDLCRRVKKAGWGIYCLPQAEIVHLLAQSTRQFRDRMFVALWRSRFLMFDKHESAAWRWAARRLVRLGLWAERRRATAPCRRGRYPKSVFKDGWQPIGRWHRCDRRLAAVVLTLSEERNIGDCLDSLAWADRRVVFDAFSTDRTVEIAQAKGAEVIQRRF